MVYEYRHQPMKGIYLTYQLLSFPLRVSYWVLVSIPRSLRGKRSWTLAQALIVRLANFLSPTGPVWSK